MRRVLILVGILFGLSGCAQWNQLSDPEKAAVIVSGAIVVGVAVMRNSSDDTTTQNCISTRSIRTGCGSFPL